MSEFSNPRRLIALLLLSAASADDIVHPREARVIQLGVGKAVYDAAQAEYEAADEVARAEMLQEIKLLLESRPAREKALELLREIFLADGRYDGNEADWMDRVWSSLVS